MTESTDQFELARNAARTANPFAQQLAGDYASIAQALRRGDDANALEALGASTDDLEHFLHFLELTRDMLSAEPDGVAATLATYRDRLLDVVESIEPALGEIDLVEVADALEDDLVPSLQDYGDLDTTVQEALRPAA